MLPRPAGSVMALRPTDESRRSAVLFALLVAGCAVSRVPDRDAGSLAPDTPLACNSSDTCRGCGTVGAPTCTGCGGEWVCGAGGCFTLSVCSPTTVPPATGTDLHWPDASMWHPDAGPDAAPDAGPDAGSWCTSGYCCCSGDALSPVSCTASGPTCASGGSLYSGTQCDWHCGGPCSLPCWDAGGGG